MAQEGSVTLGHVGPAPTLPLVIQPCPQGLDLIHWATDHRAFIEKNLLQYGALLFRGFHLKGIETFEQLIMVLYGNLMPYHDRATPRTQVQGNIYTATDYPPPQSIFVHNEGSFASHWPGKIFFYCMTPPQGGGETPLVDVRRVFHRIDGTIRETFIQKQVMYTRNFGGAFGLKWQDAFQTSDKNELESYCRTAGISIEWKDDQHLRTRQVRPAIRTHPQTGEVVWFNHATALHVSTIRAELRDMLLKMCSEEDLPNNTYYGDGTSIEPEVLEALRNAYRAETVTFSWQEADILLVDNLLVAHGRNPFKGKRQVVVGMAQPMSWADL